MQVIGFLFVLFFGLAVFIQGIGLNMLTSGFTGKLSPFGFVLIALGVYIMYLAISHSPIHFVIQ